MFFVGTKRSTTADFAQEDVPKPPPEDDGDDHQATAASAASAATAFRFWSGSVQPCSAWYPDVPCTSSWCGCPSWENPRKSASLFTMFEPSHLVCPCSQFDSLNRLLNRLLNPTFASVCSQRWSQLKPNLAHLLGGAAGQRGPERMAPGGTGGCTSDPFESPRDRSLCRSNGSHRG